MIKKISAILLALVLCLSVVVVPASAYELASGSEIAYVVELDKDHYSKGDMVTVSLYLYGKEGLEFGTGAILIAMNSALFDMSENAVADIKGTSTSGDAMASWYKDFTSASISWLTQATVINNVTGSNTAEENAMYNQYLKIGLAKNTSGTHANVAGNKNGLPAEDINADSDAGIPFISFQLKLKDDVEDGAAVNIGITSGSMTKNQTYVNYYKSPGTASTVVKTTTATSEVKSSTTATIGAAKEYETSIVSYWKDQIRMDNDAYSSFSIRHLAQISAADWEANFGTTEDSANATITDIGFILATGNGEFKKDDAANWLEDGAKDATFTKAPVNYVSTGMKDGFYVYSVIITGCTNPDASLSSLGYVVWEDAEGTTHYSYFEDVKTETFRELYDGYVDAH